MVDYQDYSPDDSGSRYDTTYNCSIKCTHKRDPIFKNIYNTLKELEEGELPDGWNDIRDLIEAIHN